MRITLLSPEYPPVENLGGIGTNTVVLARALAARGHEVTVVTKGAQAERHMEGAVSVVRLHHRWLPERNARRLLAARQVAGTVRRLRPEVVHAAEWDAQAWWLTRFSKIPVVTRLATPTYIVDELNRGSPDPASALVRWLERDQTRRSAAIYAPTRAIIDRVSADWALSPGRVEAIPNTIDVDEVIEAGATAPPILLPRQFLMFIGRIERRKGIEAFGDAMAAVLAAREDLHAVVVGRDPREEGGALLARFERSVAPVADRIHLTGQLSRTEALSIMARAEIVVLPSLWESFGYVCVEALALGRPVVASRVGGFTEIIEDGRHGWLVPPDDAATLAGTLLAKLDRPGELEGVGARARQRAADFQVDGVVDRVIELFDRVRGKDHLDSSIYRDGYASKFRPDERADPFHRLYDRKRELVLRHFSAQPRRRLLDAGAGYGRLAAPLAVHHSVTACDISAEMLEGARGSCGEEAVLVQSDARLLPFADASFDAVLALDLLCHLPDAEAGLAELMRVVRVGGELIFDTTNSVPLWVLAYPSYVNRRPRRLLRTILARGVLPEWRHLVRHHRPRELRRAAATAGLRLEPLGRVGPGPLVKWHLWRATRP